MLLCLDAVQQQISAEKSHKQFMAITEPGNNPLRDFCESRGIETLDHDPKVGGRFSVLSLVGLIPSGIKHVG